MSDEVPSKTPTDTREQFTLKEFHARLRAQGVETSNNIAFRCVMCGAVQSMRSFTLAGTTPKEAEGYIGFSCIGRVTDAGAWNGDDAERAKIVGCNWTCGGLLGALGRGVLVVVEGEKHSRFWLASPEEAQELERAGGVPFRSKKGEEP